MTWILSEALLKVLIKMEGKMKIETKKDRVIISISITKDLHDKIIEKATANSRSKSNQVTKILEDFFKKEDSNAS